MSKVKSKKVNKSQKTKMSSSTVTALIFAITATLVLLVGIVYVLTNSSTETSTTDNAGQPIQNTNTGAPVKVSWENLGEMQGEMQALLFDPTDAKIAYLSAQKQGIYRSDDGGTNWQPLGPQGKTIIDFGIDPGNGRLYAAELGGVIYSDDKGVTWNTTSLPAAEAHAVQVDPRDSKLIWAGFWLRGSSGSTLYMSMDGGKTWHPASGGPQGKDINFIKFDKESNSTYVGTYGGGLFVTNDNGSSWEALNSGLNTNTDITMLEWNSDRSVFYLGTHDFGVFHSTDKGKSWQPVNVGKESATDVHGLAADPKDPNSVYVAGMMMGKGLFKSSNHGQTWQPVETGDINLEDAHVFALSPDGKYIYVGAGEHDSGKGKLYRFKI